MSDEPILSALARLEAGQADMADRLGRLEAGQQKLTHVIERAEVKVDRLTDDMTDVKGRLSSVEQAVVSWGGSVAGQSLRIDRLEIRLSLVERRLEIRDGPS
jgi:predicted nuclease with TOPRIM domain